MNYSYGHNLPGYLPESDVWIVATFDEAKRGLIADIRYAEDSAAMGDDEDAAEDLCAAAEDVNLWSSPDYLIAAGLAWWIAETDEPVSEDES